MSFSVLLESHTDIFGAALLLFVAYDSLSFCPHNSSVITENLLFSHNFKNRPTPSVFTESNPYPLSFLLPPITVHLCGPRDTL